MFDRGHGDVPEALPLLDRKERRFRDWENQAFSGNY